MCYILYHTELKHLLSVLLCTLYSVPYLGFWYFISLRDKTEKRYDLFCDWKSRVRIPHWYFLSFFYQFFKLFLLLLRDNGHCWWKSWSVITSSVTDHSHTWDKNIPFYGCQRFFFHGLLVSFWDKNAVSNCPSLLHEPPHDKTNRMACVPSEDSDQPGHPPSLIRVFAVRMKKAWVLS